MVRAMRQGIHAENLENASKSRQEPNAKEPEDDPRDFYTPQPRTSNITGVACIAKRPIPAYTKTLVKTVKVVEPRLQRAIGGKG